MGTRTASWAFECWLRCRRACCFVCRARAFASREASATSGGLARVGFVAALARLLWRHKRPSIVTKARER